MRRAGGFTLIELMIVVAIIALLAAIAIPNFLAFQCRSKQAEVKTSLGGIYTVEKTFLTEHNTYTTDLVVLGWRPEGRPLYLYGFDASYPASLPPGSVPNYNPDRNTTRDPEVVGAPPLYDVGRMVNLEGAILDVTDLPATLCDGQSFVVGAVADIRPDISPPMLDRWVIDQQRFISPARNDCLN